MTKLAVFTDLHLSLPASETLLVDIERQACDEIIHLGDAVAIGPLPGKGLEMMRLLPNASFIMGKYDDWMINGQLYPAPDWLFVGEIDHYD